MILIGIGANLTSPIHGPPLLTCEAAIRAICPPPVRATDGSGDLINGPISLIARSRWWRSKPVPPSGQPWFINGVIRISTELDPKVLLEYLHEVERAFGRVRGEKNAARVLDLDLLTYGDEVIETEPLTGPEMALIEEGGEAFRIPHPRLSERAFVLYPIADIAPDWVHPETGKPLKALVKLLDPEQVIQPVEPARRPNVQRPDPRFGVLMEEG
ncbi:MAG: 2-amino-4-hydroxy-6-hydroxymethyldihydropteridine diphosphokinase [Magnetovibrionaceae bacterium]